MTLRPFEPMQNERHVTAARAGWFIGRIDPGRIDRDRREGFPESTPLALAVLASTSPAPTGFGVTFGPGARLLLEPSGAASQALTRHGDGREREHGKHGERTR